METVKSVDNRKKENSTEHFNSNKLMFCYNYVDNIEININTINYFTESIRVVKRNSYSIMANYGYNFVCLYNLQKRT